MVSCARDFKHCFCPTAVGLRSPKKAPEVLAAPFFGPLLFCRPRAGAAIRSKGASTPAGEGSRKEVYERAVYGNFSLLPPSACTDMFDLTQRFGVPTSLKKERLLQPRFPEPCR